MSLSFQSDSFIGKIVVFSFTFLYHRRQNNFSVYWVPVLFCSCTASPRALLTVLFLKLLFHQALCSQYQSSASLSRSFSTRVCSTHHPRPTTPQAYFPSMEKGAQAGSPGLAAPLPRNQVDRYQEGHSYFSTYLNPGACRALLRVSSPS